MPQWCALVRADRTVRVRVRFRAERAQARRYKAPRFCAGGRPQPDRRPRRPRPLPRAPRVAGAHARMPRGAAPPVGDGRRRWPSEMAVGHRRRSSQSVIAVGDGRTKAPGDRPRPRLLCAVRVDVPCDRLPRRLQRRAHPVRAAEGLARQRRARPGRPAHVCAGTAALPTSVPGLGSPLPTSALGLGSPRPRRRQDWAHTAHVGAGVWLAPPTSAPGLGSPLSASAPGLGLMAQALAKLQPLKDKYGDGLSWADLIVRGCIAATRCNMAATRCNMAATRCNMAATRLQPDATRRQHGGNPMQHGCNMAATSLQPRCNPMQHRCNLAATRFNVAATRLHDTTWLPHTTP